MTADEIADQVAEYLNAAEGKPFKFKAANPEEMAEAQAERADVAVFVVPYAEAEAPFDQGSSCRRDRTVSIVVNGPAAVLTKRKGMKLSEWIRAQLEGTEFSKYLWTGNETVSLYDVDALKTKKQFLSLARASFYGLG